jgi:Fur family transcriptional regulator, ferric uptake regulator
VPPANDRKGDLQGLTSDDAPGLRRLGLRATPPRLKVLQLLRGSERRHWSAEQLHRELTQAGEDIGLATVYRVLGQLEQAGILRRSSFEAGKAVFELDDGPHHDHLVCVRCGRVEEFADEAIERRQEVLAEERGFKLVEHRLAMFGVCGHCGGLPRR